MFRLIIAIIAQKLTIKLKAIIIILRLIILNSIIPILQIIAVECLEIKERSRDLSKTCYR